MTTRSPWRPSFWSVVLTVTMGASAFAAEPPKTPPDLTTTNWSDRRLTYNLGATGLRGWIYTRPADFFESQQGRTTTASRQILVTHVGAKSPEDEVMRVDDVILGAGGKLFTDDARKSIALAIQEPAFCWRKPRAATAAKVELGKS